MRKYLSVMRIGLLDAFEYRTELFIRIFGWGIRLFISLFLWYAVIQARGGEAVGAYSFEKMILYFFLIQIMATFMFNDSGFHISRDIQYGDFSNYLVKPIRYLPFCFSLELSFNITRSLIGIVLFGGILAFIKPEFYITLVQSPDRFFLFLISIAIAMLINFHLVSLIAILSFWIVSAQRLLFMYFGIINIFSGLIIPIDLLPAPLFDIVRLLPFPYIFYFPLEIILKPEFSLLELTGRVILPQIIHLSILAIILSLVFQRGLKHYEAVGR